MSSNEAQKLQQHLSLLREQYVRLQERCLTLEQKLAIATASQNLDDQDSFLIRLLKFVASLYDKDEYCDVKVKLCDGEIRAHRFVLAARGDFWGVATLADVSYLDWCEFETGVGKALLMWVYTDNIELTDHVLALKLIKAAAKFKLEPLVQRCEEALIGWVNVRNCVQLYTTAEDIGANGLKDHCSTLISTHWNDFSPEDFVHMSAPLLYAMFKSKTEFILHAAVRLQREDVLFLYLIEFDSKLPHVLNKIDDTGCLALDLALKDRNSNIATTLLKHEASIDAVDSQGSSLLHYAVKRGDNFAAKFLLDNGANVNLKENQTQQLALHVIASTNYSSDTMDEDMAQVAQTILEQKVDINAQDVHLKTCLHLAVENGKKSLLLVLLQQKELKLTLVDNKGLPPLWYALNNLHHEDQFDFASRLLERGADIDQKTSTNGNTLLHLIAEERLEEAGLFLTAQGASHSLCNVSGESPLHLSCTYGLPFLTTALLRAGCEANLMTFPPSPTNDSFVKDKNPFDDDNCNLFRETPLHRAIRNLNFEDVHAILDHKKECESSTNSSFKIPSLNLQDSEGLPCIGVALFDGHLDVAVKLLESGADVNQFDHEGRTLLHRAILAKKIELAIFLLKHSADSNLRTMNGMSPLLLCIEQNLPAVIASLCENSADLSAADSASDSPLWLALDAKLLEIADILVRYKADIDGWSEGPDGCKQTLLHRAIDENREDIGCFLVCNGCNVNALRKEGLGGRGADVARDQQTPLHMCCSWGLVHTAMELISFGAKINCRDFEAKTPLHLALENNHGELIFLVLEQPGLDLEAKDEKGQTAFAVAMATKNNKAAEAILKKNHSAAEQYDHKGMNFLHRAIQKNDLESVLFLLSIHVSLSSRTKDDQNLTPLHLATVHGNEMVVRNLLLAGAGLNELTQQKRTCLHLCSLHDHASLSAIFIQNDIDVDALDDGLDNALHTAVKEGHLNVVKVLLTESRINAGAVNLKGQNCLHVLASYPKDNAAAIAKEFLQNMPEYPIDNSDVDGNTALLSAYIRGAGQLCRVFVNAGACLGLANKQGIHLFNYEVASKTLLRRLLDALAQEPPWSEGDLCLECSVKFGIATRRHHCRHCGRLLCGKCSGKDVPILKFGISKPVRVCQMCFDVLTLGPNAGS